MPASRVAGLVITVVAGTCVTLAGCGGGSSGPSNSTGSSSSAAASTGSSGASGGTTGSVGKLTGNFCTDFKNLGTSVKMPANASGSLSALQQNGVPYLREVAAYFNGLAGEASPQAGKELRIIAGYYQTLAASIGSGNVNSLSKIEQQMASLATRGTSGAAFRSLIAYMVTKCAVAG